MNYTETIEELSAMAVVLYDGKILATREMIYGKETLSLPKGHKEDGGTLTQTAMRECFEETNIILSNDELVRELESFSYEFLTPQEKHIRKTIVPFLFKVGSAGEPIAKEDRMVAVEWMSIDEFLDKCTHENVRSVVLGI